MNSNESILVAVALDDRDAIAIQHAVRFAGATRATAIYLAHVAPDLDLPDHVVKSHPELIEAELDETASGSQIDYTSDPLVCFGAGSHPRGQTHILTGRMFR